MFNERDSSHPIRNGKKRNCCSRFGLGTALSARRLFSKREKLLSNITHKSWDPVSRRVALQHLLPRKRFLVLCIFNPCRLPEEFADCNLLLTSLGRGGKTISNGITKGRNLVMEGEDDISVGSRALTRASSRCCDGQVQSVKMNSSK